MTSPALQQQTGDPSDLVCYCRPRLFPSFPSSASLRNFYPAFFAHHPPQIPGTLYDLLPLPLLPRKLCHIEGQNHTCCQSEFRRLVLISTSQSPRLARATTYSFQPPLAPISISRHRDFLNCFASIQPQSFTSVLDRSVYHYLLLL